MARHDEVSAYLDLSHEYLSSAERVLAAGEIAPSRFLTVHALELAVKAAIVVATGVAPRTHNVGGEFGKLFREKAGPEVARRVSRLLAEYDAPRYPEWAPPALEEVRADLAFVQHVVRVVVPALGRGLP